MLNIKHGEAVLIKDHIIKLIEKLRAHFY